MPKHCLRLHSAVTVALLALTVGCSSTSPRNAAKEHTGAARNAVTQPLTAPDPATRPQVDPFVKGVEKAQSAANLAQSARSKQDWDQVVGEWLQAIAGMQAVPPESPKRVFAQKKVVEYLTNLEAAQFKATTTGSQLPFASFSNAIFDEQLLLYLSYVAALGPPDVLIVGSSRALQGVDPQQLQQALVRFGKGNLKIFNFGVNGGTAQLIDFQLRQLLTQEQLPRLILWADGVRAFNSGRLDRTFDGIVASPGYRGVLAGSRPTLPQSGPETAAECENIPEAAISHTKNPARATLAIAPWRLARVSFASRSREGMISRDRLLSAQNAGFPPVQPLALGRSNTGYSSFAIDANGFLAMDSRFDPQLYYQQNPQVAGLYDGDYQPFSFAGPQTIALNSIQAFARERQIPLVFVNLPLTQDYLDPERLNREQQFRQLMQQQANAGLIFVDLGREWVDQYQYFADPSHLNRLGAAAVATQLATNPQIPWPQSWP